MELRDHRWRSPSGPGGSRPDPPAIDERVAADQCAQARRRYAVIARTARQGLLVGAMLTAMMVWMVVPLAIGISGRWLVPSFGDMLTWYPWVTAGICLIGVWAVRSRPDHRTHREWAQPGWFSLTALAVAACCSTCPGWWLATGGKPPGDERIFPMPAGLDVRKAAECEMDYCWGTATITGDRADSRVRAHLAACGYRLPTQDASEYSVVTHHRTGVLIPHHVQLSYRLTDNGAVHLTWSVKPAADVRLS